MKVTRFVGLLMIGLVLLMTTGCRRGVQNERRIYGRIPDRVQDQPAGALPGGEQGTLGMGNDTIPLTGPGRTGWSRDESALSASTILFDYDSSAVKPSEKSKVSGVADQLKGNTRVAVEVQGHADERGTEEYNRSLAERRALAVREELVRLGIDPNRVDTVTFGEDRPADPGHNEAAWRKNRRAEFILLTPPSQ